jgi:hypothetical protein
VDAVLTSSKLISVSLASEQRVVEVQRERDENFSSRLFTSNPT